MENRMADNGWVFTECKGLAYCKTLARETQGCAGPELIQWQQLLRARVRLGLPQEYEAWCRCRRASVRLSRRDLRSALLPQDISYGPQG